MEDVIERLIESDEPSMHLRARIKILGESCGSTTARELQIIEQVSFGRVGRCEPEEDERVCHL